MKPNIKQRVSSTSQLEIQFTLSLLDSTVVESTRPGENFSFTMGDGQLFTQLESLLIDLQLGNHVTFQLAPEQAFGQANEDNIQSLQKTDFPPELVFKEGNVIGFNTPAGEEVPGTIVEIHEDDVRVDFNHPLAGHNLIFDVKIIKIIELSD